MGASSSRSRKLCRPAGDVIQRRSHRGGGGGGGCNSHVAASVHLVSMRPGSSELSSAAPAAPPAVRCAPRGRLERPGTRGVSGVRATPRPPPTTIIIIISRWRRPTRGLLYFQHCPSSLLPPPLLHHIWIHCRNFSFFFFFALPSECFILFFSMMVMRTEQNNNQCRPSMGT